MAYPQERRTQVFTGPGFDNRPFRKGKITGFSQKQNFDPRRSGADAAAFAEDELGMKADSQGNWGAVRDYGRDMMLGSQQRNSLSRGTPGGYASGLGNPLNSNLTPRGFADSLQQRNQGMSREQRIAQAQQDGTFGTIRDKFNTDNAGAGLSMNRFGNIGKMNPPQTTPSGMKLDNTLIEKRGFGNPPPQTASVGGPPATQTAATPNTGLQDRAAGLRLLREMSQTPLQIDRSAGGGNDTLIQGKYGSGFSSTAPAGVKRPTGMEGAIGTSGSMRGTRPFSEVMQGLANKQVREGAWSEGDRLPEGMTAEQAYKTNEEARQKILSRQRIAAKNR